jgi:hypothetical protein
MRDDEFTSTEEEPRPEDHANTLLDMTEHKSEVASMWSNAADVNLVDTESVPTQSPFHFDLASLA